jgi:hypothetical protein
MAEYDEREGKPRTAPIIEDKRHIRNVDDVDELEAEPAAEPEAEAPAGEPAPSMVAEAASPEPVPQQPAPSQPQANEATVSAAEPPAEPMAAGEADAPEMPTEEELAQMQQAEYAYLMQLFQLGLHGYLRSQLGILLNFALISLGRAPNPSTGLVTADLDQAKLAIDSMEFIMLRVQASMQPQERAEMTQWLSDLKYTFMQSLGGAAAVVKGGDGEA